MSFIRRHGRYKTLRGNGFLLDEAREFSKVPLNVPYMKSLIQDRRNFVAQAKAQGWTDGQIESAIKQDYVDNDWFTHPDSPHIKPKLSPWRMLHDYEDDFRNKQPTYTSPWQKRRRDFTSFVRKTERTIAMQSGTYHD